jgi:hypothetical protein
LPQKTKSPAVFSGARKISTPFVDSDRAEHRRQAGMAVVMVAMGVRGTTHQI